MYSCPSCQSDNIQRLSIVYEGGLSDINTKSSGTAIGFGRGGVSLGVGGSKTKGSSQTETSKRAAPPAKKPYLKPIAVIFVVFMLFSFFAEGNKFLGILNSVFLLGGEAGWIFYAFNYNRNNWPPLKSVWDKSYLCNRCAQIFTLPG